MFLSSINSNDNFLGSFVLNNNKKQLEPLVTAHSTIAFIKKNILLIYLLHLYLLYLLYLYVLYFKKLKPGSKVDIQ